MNSVRMPSAVALTKTFAAAQPPKPTLVSQPQPDPPAFGHWPMSPASTFAALGKLSPAAQWFQMPVFAQAQGAAPNPAPAAPTPPAGPGGIPLARIGQNLDALQIRTEVRELGLQPNFISLNEIASANTPPKRAAFAAMKKARDGLEAAKENRETRRERLETRKNAVEGLEVEIGDRAMRVAALDTRVQELQRDLRASQDPDERRALELELRDARADLGSVRTELQNLRTRKSGATTAMQRAERELQAAERTVVTAERNLTTEAGRFHQWIEDHGKDHNRELRALNDSMAGAERSLRRARARGADAATIQGLENQIEFLSQQRLAKINDLDARIEAFEPLVEIRQNHHQIDVDGERVRLHDHAVTYATDTPEGLEGHVSNEGAATVQARLSASTLSVDKQNILAIVSGHEGSFSTINTWDRAKVTAGFLQWTLGEEGNGSLVGLMSEIKTRAPAAFRDRFQSYGLDVSGREVQLTRPDGTVLTGADAAAAIQRDPKLAAALSRAGADPRIQDVQVTHGAATKIDAVRASRIAVAGQAVQIRDVLSSEYGVGLMTDRAVHSGEGAVRGTVSEALSRFMQAHPGADLSNPVWAARAEASVVAALEAMDRVRARSFASLSHQHGSFNP